MDLANIRAKVANIMSQPAAKLADLNKVANKGCKLANKQKIWLLKMKSAIIRLKVSNKGSSFSLFQEFGRGEMLEC